MSSKANNLILTFASLLCLVIILEIILHTLFPASKPPLGMFDHKNLMYVSDTTIRTGYTTRGAWPRKKTPWVINSRGWNFISQPQKEIAPSESNFKTLVVIGDSYIEGLQVSPQENLAYLLQKKLIKSAHVHAFGKSGAPLSQYLHISRYSKKILSPDVLIFNLVENDFWESSRDWHPEKKHFLQFTFDSSSYQYIENLPSDPLLDRKLPRLRRLLYKSALMRYLVYNLQVFSRNQYISPQNKLFMQTNKDSTLHSASNFTKSQDPTSQKMRQLISAIFTKIREEFPHTKIIFLMDGDRFAITHALPHDQTYLYHKSIVFENCRYIKANCIDLHPIQKKYYLKTHQDLYSGNDYHWNKNMHQLAAEVLAQQIIQKF